MLSPNLKGGTDHADNCVTACRPCNQAKGSMHVDVFMQTILKSGSVILMSFPENPNLGDTHTFENTVFTFNGRTGTDYCRP